MSKRIIKRVAGIDNGNGNQKAIIGVPNRLNQGIQTSRQSMAVKRFNTTTSNLIPIDEVPADFKENVFDNMELSFISPLVIYDNDPESEIHRIFGKRASSSGDDQEVFDVKSQESKASVSLFGALTLAALVDNALISFWDTTPNEFPTDIIEMHVDLATALPIMEFSKHESHLKKILLNDGVPHIAIVHNFEKEIQVNIIFKSVVLMNEGAAAIERIRNASKDFRNAILTDAKTRYPNGEFDDLTGEELVSLPSSIGIDIGEGTIDFAVFTNNKFNQDASRSFKHGYADVLEAALKILQESGRNFQTRKDLAEYIQNKPTIKHMIPAYNEVINIVHNEGVRFTEKVISDTSQLYARANSGGMIAAIFVSGGGSGPIESSLFKSLKAFVETSHSLMPILYLDSQYSRFLNALGLYSAAQKSYKLAREKSNETSN